MNHIIINGLNKLFPEHTISINTYKILRYVNIQLEGGIYWLRLAQSVYSVMAGRCALP